MGRKKIKIQPIQGRNRQVTYLKRKAGLFKKAYELATLTDSQVAIIVFGHNGRLSQFCSTDMDRVLLRYTEHEGPIEHKGAEDYANQSAGNGGGGGGEDEDEGDGAADDFPDFSREPSGGTGGPSGGSAGGQGSGSGQGATEGRGGSSARPGGSGGPSGDNRSSNTAGSFGDASSTGTAAGTKRGSDALTAANDGQFKLDRTRCEISPKANPSSPDKQNLRHPIAMQFSSGGLDCRASSAQEPSVLKVKESVGQQAQLQNYYSSQWTTSPRKQSGLTSFEPSIRRATVPTVNANKAQSKVGASSSLSNSTQAQVTRAIAALAPEARMDFARFVQRQMSSDQEQYKASQSCLEVTVQGRQRQQQQQQQQQQQLQQQHYLQTQQQQLMSQEIQQRRVAPVPVTEQRSLALSQGSSADVQFQEPLLGTTPFMSSMTMTDAPGIQSKWQIDGEPLCLPSSASASATPSAYPFLGADTGRPSISRDDSSSGFSNSSVCFTRRGTDEYGNPVGLSESSTDGTPLLAASSLATPSESPRDTFGPPGSMYSPSANAISTARSDVEAGRMTMPSVFKGMARPDDAIQYLFPTGDADSTQTPFFGYRREGEAPLYGL